MLLVDTAGSGLATFAGYARERGIRCVGSCSTTDDMLFECERLRPNIVVVDLGVMGSLNPLTAIQRLRRTHVETMVIATAPPSESQQLMEAMTMGAADFVMKPYRRRTIIECLERLLG